MTDRLHGSLIYPYTEHIHDLFLESFVKKGYTMMKDEKEIGTGQISLKLRQLLTKKGYKFLEKKTTYFRGKKEAFGCKMEVRKIVDQRNMIRQVSIKVPGNTMADVRARVKIIRDQVRRLLNIEPEEKIWDRLEDC